MSDKLTPGAPRWEGCLLFGLGVPGWGGYRNRSYVHTCGSSPENVINLHCRNGNRRAAPPAHHCPAFRGNDPELNWRCSSCSLLCLTSCLSIHQLIPFAPQTAAPLSSPPLFSTSQGVDSAPVLPLPSGAVSPLLCP